MSSLSSTNTLVRIRPQAKTIGGIGAILVLLSFVPAVGAAFGVIGFVLILVAVKHIADDLKDKKIFDNMIIAVFLSIVGVIVGSLILLGTVLSAFGNGYFSTSYPFTPSTAVTTAQWITFGTDIALGLFGAWVFFLASAVYLRRSYSTIGSKINVGMFRNAGLLYLIGAATTLVGVGFLILLVAEIMTAVAFFSIPEQRVVPQAFQPQTLPASY